MSSICPVVPCGWFRVSYLCHIRSTSGLICAIFSRHRILYVPYSLFAECPACAQLSPARYSSQFKNRNVKRFRGGLVSKAHRLLYHSTLGSRGIKKKRRRRRRAQSGPRARMSSMSPVVPCRWFRVSYLCHIRSTSDLICAIFAFGRMSSMCPAVPCRGVSNDEIGLC